MDRRVPIALLVLAGILGGMLRGAGAEPAAVRGPTLTAGAFFALTEDEAKASGRSPLPGDVHTAGLRFAAGVDVASRAAVATSIGRARPEAARLIALVDSLVEVRVGDAGPRALGVTTDHGGRYDMILDLAQAQVRYGERGVDRIVLHELGHVMTAPWCPRTSTRRSTPRCRPVIRARPADARAPALRAQSASPRPSRSGQRAISGST